MSAPSPRPRSATPRPLANAFVDHTDPPTGAELARALGVVEGVWGDFLGQLARDGIADTHAWKSHSVKWGWSLRVLKKQRTIVWLSPGRGGFNVLFILSSRAVAAARAAKLPQRIFAALDAAPKYPEGTGLSLGVRSSRDLPALCKLAAIKAAN